MPFRAALTEDYGIWGNVFAWSQSEQPPLSDVIAVGVCKGRAAWNSEEEDGYVPLPRLAPNRLPGLFLGPLATPDAA